MLENAVTSRSVDAGETWQPSSIPVNTPSSANAMAFDPVDPSHAFLHAGPLLETSDNGGSWRPISLPEPGSGSALDTRGFGPLRLYANSLPSEGSKVWMTDDDGSTWNDVALAGSARGMVVAMRVHSGPAADTLFLGMANGMLRYVESAIVEVNLLRQPSGLWLEAYPRPSHGLVIVAFRLPTASKVSLRLLDTTGREVATMLDGERPAGDQRLVWRSPGLPSGGYFVELRTGSGVTARKVVFIR